MSFWFVFIIKILNVIHGLLNSSRMRISKARRLSYLLALGSCANFYSRSFVPLSPTFSNEMDSPVFFSIFFFHHRLELGSLERLSAASILSQLFFIFVQYLFISRSYFSSSDVLLLLWFNFYCSRSHLQCGRDSMNESNHEPGENKKKTFRMS